MVWYHHNQLRPMRLRALCDTRPANKLHGSHCLDVPLPRPDIDVSSGYLAAVSFVVKSTIVIGVNPQV